MVNKLDGNRVLGSWSKPAMNEFDGLIFLAVETNQPMGDTKGLVKFFAQKEILDSKASQPMGKPCGFMMKRTRRSLMAWSQSADMEALDFWKWHCLAGKQWPTFNPNVAKGQWIVNNAHNAFVNGWLTWKQSCNAMDASFWLGNDDWADCKKNESWGLRNLGAKSLSEQGGKYEV